MGIGCVEALVGGFERGEFFIKKRRSGKKGLRLRRVFDTILPLSYGAVAQLVEHHVRNVGVRGSNPLRSTI